MDGAYQASTPMLILDDTGGVAENRHTGFSRAPLIADFDQVEPAYRALRRLAAMTMDGRYRIQIRYEPGTAIVFDNRRILHTRSEFDASTGSRHLQGVYLRRDEWRSRRLMLERQERARRLR